MSYVTYKLVHLLGIFTLLTALAGLTGEASSGRPKEESRSYRSLLALHGVGAVLALIGGFGLLARTGVFTAGGFPGWVVAKLLLWLTLAGLVALPYRRRGAARVLLFLLPLFGLLGGFLANYKPF